MGMLDGVLYVMMYLWITVGPLILGFVFFLAIIGSATWNDLIRSIVVFVVGVVFLSGHYDVIGIFAGFYDAIRGAVVISSDAQSSSGLHRTLLLIYMHVKYFVKILIYSLIASMFGVKSGLMKKLFLGVVMIYTVSILIRLDLNLENLIRNEARISSTIVLLFILYTLCKKFLDAPVKHLGALLYTPKRNENVTPIKKEQLSFVLIGYLVAFIFNAVLWGIVDRAVFG